MANYEFLLKCLHNGFPFEVVPKEVREQRRKDVEAVNAANALGGVSFDGNVEVPLRLRWYETLGTWVDEIDKVTMHLKLNQFSKVKDHREWWENLPLAPDGIVSSVVGRWSKFVGGFPTRWHVGPSDYDLLCAIKLLPPAMAKFINLSRTYSVGGSADTTSWTLRELAQASDISGTYEDLMHVRRVASRYLFLPFIKWVPGPSDLMNVWIESTTNPGFLTRALFWAKVRRDFPWRRKYGAYNKAQAVGPSLGVAARYLRAMTRYKINLLPLSFYGMGGREKLVTIEAGDEKKKLEARPILMPELGTYLVNACFAQLITTYWPKFLKDKSPLWLGWAPAKLGWLRVHERFGACATIIETDAKKFDSTLPDPVIRAAFCILRGCFPRGTGVSIAFASMYATFISKLIVAPGGWVYHVMKGIPSGSAWTSLVGSLCTYLIWYDAVLHWKGFRGVDVKDVRMAIGGDDVLFGVVGDIQLSIDLEELTIWFEDRWGYKIKDPQFKSIESIIPEEMPSFYKVAVGRHGFAVRWADVIPKLRCPPKAKQIKDLGAYAFIRANDLAFNETQARDYGQVMTMTDYMRELCPRITEDFVFDGSGIDLGFRFNYNKYSAFIKKIRDFFGSRKWVAGHKLWTDGISSSVKDIYCRFPALKGSKPPVDFSRKGRHLVSFYVGAEYLFNSNDDARALWEALFPQHRALFEKMSSRPPPEP